MNSVQGPVPVWHTLTVELTLIGLKTGRTGIATPEGNR